MAPYFANIFMASIEQTFIDNSPLTPLFYVRFIDHIFMIWTHGNEELYQLTTRANSSHPLYNSPQKYLLLVYRSWMYLLVSLKPVLRHRYTENQPIALPTLCNVVFILISSNHPLSLVNFLDSNVNVQIFLTTNMRLKFSLKAFYPEAILTN